MIIYSKEKKTLIIPSGMGGVGGGQADCDEQIAAARAQGYNSGVTAGRNAQKREDDAKITQSITIVENGQYNAEYGYKRVNVNVPTGANLQSKNAIIQSETQDVYPDTGYQGMSSVHISAVNFGNEKYQEGYQGGFQGGRTEGYTEGHQAGYTEGYTEGYEEGIGEQGCQGAYSEGYQAGYQGGETAQKNKLTSTYIDSNGHFTREDGWNEITVDINNTPHLEIRSYNLEADWGGEAVVNPSSGYDGFRYFGVYDIGYGDAKRQEGYQAGYQGGYTEGYQGGIQGPQGYQAGYQGGEAAQKAKLTNATFTTNGTYTREDGYNEVVVNVSGGSGCNIQREKTYYLPPTTSNLAVTHPDLGYDGVYELRIDCSDMYHQRWDEGAEYARSQMADVTLTSNGTYTYGVTGANYYGVKTVTVNVPSTPCNKTITFTGSFTNANACSVWDVVGPLSGDTHWEYVKLDNVDISSGSQSVPAGTHTIEVLGGSDYFGTTVTPNFSLTGLTWNSIQMSITES